MTPSIRLENISKRYRIGTSEPIYQTLRESVMETLGAPIRYWNRHNRESAPDRHILALENISFEIMPGEAVGIIGRNGAGKTTLLKILSRITQPTSGRAELRGRVGTLLEVGTGFHSELTGKENVYLNGAILGMKRIEVMRKLDRIVDFSGVEKFLDTPMKYYSSGMRVRLAFAIAAHLDTEILLADEVLAVGDTAFRTKCVEEMGSLAQHGRTVLFVSHNMGVVADLCPRSLLLEKGRLQDFGKTRDVIHRYLSEVSPNTATVEIAPPPTETGVAITRVTITDDAGSPRAELDWQRPFSIAVEFRVTARINALSVGVTLMNGLGIRVLFSWIVFQTPFDPGTYHTQGHFPGETLVPGRYSIDVDAADYGVKPYHMMPQVASFEILQMTGEFIHGLDGHALVYARIPWEIRSVL